LGVLVYRALTGRRPFEGGTQEVLMAHLQGTPADPSAIEPSLPPALDAVVRKALARDPRQRYASAGEFARALRSAVGMGSVPPAMQRGADGRPVVPQGNLGQPVRPNLALADQPTRRGTFVPQVAPPRQSATGTTFQHSSDWNGRNSAAAAVVRREPRANGAAWVILGVVLALAIGGGMLYASGLLPGRLGNTGG